MITIKQLYAQEDPAQVKRVWDKFVFLNPGCSYLKRETTTRALQESDRNFPLQAFKFRLFPDESIESAQERLRQCMNRGISAINELSERYLDEAVYAVVKLPEIHSSFDPFDFVRAAREHWERAVMRRSRVDPWGLVKAYSHLQAIEFGYRVGMIDICPEVLNSLRYFDTATSRLEELIGFSEPRVSERKSYPIEWSTHAQVSAYSSDATIPVRKRVKYRAGKDSSEPRYSSILMKMYSQLAFPNEINDYIATEIIVQDEAASDQLISFLRKNQPTGILERYKDSTTGKRPDKASSTDFRVKKFLIRVPVCVENISGHSSGRVYQSVPIEVQVLTSEDAVKRDAVPEISHFEYKRRQFLEVFPIWFPRKIYEPMLRTRGIA